MTAVDRIRFYSCQEQERESEATGSLKQDRKRLEIEQVKLITLGFFLYIQNLQPFNNTNKKKEALLCFAV